MTVTPPASFSRLTGPASSGENGNPATPGCFLRMEIWGAQFAETQKRFCFLKRQTETEKMSDCGGEEESSCQSKTDRSEDLSTLPVCSNKPGPSHSRLKKDAGGVYSMFTADPSSATGMRKDRRENITQDLRDHWVHSLVRFLPLTPDQVVKARKIEGDIYKSANSRNEYYQLISEKINKIQEERWKHLQKQSLDFWSSSMNQPPCDSDLTMDPNTKLHQSADKTEVGEGREKKQFAAGASTSLRKDAGGVDSMFTADSSSATGMREEWYENMIQRKRNDSVRRLADALPQTPDQMVEARKIEGDIYKSANSLDEYSHLLSEKIYKIWEEKRRQLQKQSLDLGSTSMDQPPCDSDLTMDPNTKLHQSADKTEKPSSSGGVISSSVSRSPHQKEEEESSSLDTTEDDSHLKLDPNIKPDLSEDQKDVMMSEQLSSLNLRSPSQDTSVDDAHLTQDENTRQDEDETEASSHFTPELLNESGSISYRFTCPGPGVFWCKLTKLVFTMDREGKVSYKAVQWDENRLQLNGKRPAGLLFDIKCSSENAVSKLHFPHCEIKPAPHCLSVVHISKDGMSILEPLEITDTHVVVDVPHLSAFGPVWDIKRFFSPNPEPIRGQVLLFHRPAYMNQSPKLNVFLLPENVPLQEVKGQQQQHENVKYIVTPSSCELVKGQTYSLHCSEAKIVQPKSAQFDLNYGPNYHPTFEIRLTLSTNEATVTVQDQEKRRVWEYQAELPGSTSISVSHSSALSTQPPASQPTTAEERATQRDARSTAINAENGSVVSQPHLRDVHAARNINMRVNNTYYDLGPRTKKQKRI